MIPFGGTDKLTRRCGPALLDGDLCALYVDANAHSERVLRSKDALHSHFPVAELVNLSVPEKVIEHEQRMAEPYVIWSFGTDSNEKLLVSLSNNGPGAARFI